MTTETVVLLGSDVSRTVLLVSGPLLMTGLVVGILISMFQQVTSLREMTLTVVPKIAIVIVAMIYMMPWMLQVIISYTQKLYLNMPFYVRGG